MLKRIYSRHFSTLYFHFPFCFPIFHQYQITPAKITKKEKGHVPYPCHTRGFYITLHAIASKSSKPSLLLINLVQSKKSFCTTTSKVVEEPFTLMEGNKIKSCHIKFTRLGTALVFRGKKLSLQSSKPGALYLFHLQTPFAKLFS